MSIKILSVNFSLGNMISKTFKNKFFVIFPFIDKKTYGELVEEFHPVRWSLQNAYFGFTDTSYFWILWNMFPWYLKFMLICVLTPYD